MVITINGVLIENWNKIEIYNEFNQKSIIKSKNITKYNIKKPNIIDITKLIMTSGALVTGDFSGLEAIIKLLQQFSYYVGLGYGLWGVIEYTMDNPAGGTKVKRAVTGYIGIYVLPIIFKAIRDSLS